MKLIFLLFISFAIHAKSINQDITGDGVSDHIKILRDSNKRYTDIEVQTVDNFQKEKTRIKTNNLIPILKNSNGWSYNLFDLKIGEELSIDGEKIELIDFHFEDNKKLFLQSRVNGALFAINLYIKYDKKKRSFIFDNFYYMYFSENCSNELVSIYNLDIEGLKGKGISKVSLVDYKEIMSPPNIEFIISNKLMQERIYNNYLDLIESFKNKDIKRLKSLIEDNFLFYSQEKEGMLCQEDSYIYEAYFFADNVEFSNNLAFFLYLSGYYLESIVLLEEIIKYSPQRIVAYLNLADAYWDTKTDHLKQKSIIFYNKYKSEMTKKGSQKLIPKYVYERTQ